MVKLSRIIKKFVSTNEQNESKKKEVFPVTESFASKGRPQPTIDFSNLPSFESIKLLEEGGKSPISNTRLKKLIKVNKNSSHKIKPNKLKHEKYKTKLYERNRVNNSVTDEHTKFKSEVVKKHEDKPKEDKSESISRKDKLKVIKKDQSLSRGKRKRELKKEAWRRKNEFKNEAKKIIEQFQKEDKHGKALGNLSGMKSQLEQIEESIRSRNDLKKQRVKMRSKLTPKTILKNRKIFNVSTSNL
ncbi:hypothetical protein MACK_004041 [Theileria orientalis]|uniref:Uncharacterized protein n=1 Tax=Theileria orientalis TaxID=68886 RepID=A0A976SJT9_THEOR|nr:hypothetical protein MACK_004041 [Theileria orientalis]